MKRRTDAALGGAESFLSETARVFCALSGEALVLLTPGDRVFDVSEAAERLLGRSRDELVGRAREELFIELGFPAGRAHRDPSAGAEAEGAGDERLVIALARESTGAAEQGSEAERRLLCASWPLPSPDSERGDQVAAGTVLRLRETGAAPSEVATRPETTSALARFRSYFDSLPMPAFVFERLGPDDLVLRACNRMADEANENKASSFVGRRASEIFHDRVDLRENLLRCLDQKPRFASETDYTTRSTGRRGRYLFHYSRVGPGEVLLLAENVTEARTFAARLLLSEARYRALTETSPDLIFVLDGEGRYRFANSATTRLLGVSREELRLGGERGLGRPETARNHLAFVRRVLETGSPLLVREEIDLPGGPRCFETHLTPMEEKGEKLVHGIARDVTERVRADEERRRLEAQVRQAQKLESLGVLASGIAHDFNNLLVGILGNADLALESLPKGAPEKEFLRGIRCAAERSAELVNEMLSYAGGQSVERVTFDLRLLAAEMRSLIAAGLPKNVRVEFETDERPEKVPCEGDPTQLRQVLLNLVTNASDALGTEGGQVKVSLRALAEEPELSGFFVVGRPPIAPLAELLVEDGGPGMDQETVERVFDPFFTTKAEGRGLGLSTVLGIVRSHGGALFVRSAPGAGTTMGVLLPLALPAGEATSCRDAQRKADESGFLGDEHSAPEEPARSSGPEGRRGEAEAATRPAEASPAAAAGRGVALAVDDETGVRAVVRRMLARSGFEVVEARSGEEALEHFSERAGRFDLVVLDVTLPGISGLDVARHLRAHDAELPLLLTSGYSGGGPLSEVLDERMGFLQKPYRREQLLDAIERLLGA